MEDEGRAERRRIGVVWGEGGGRKGDDGELLLSWPDRRPQALHFLKYGIAISKKRQDTPSTTPAPHPFFTFLINCDDAMDHILSFLDPLNYGVERKGGMTSAV